ncbi:acyl-CoA thioester hydrolase/BAAT C-terminal domain-containing protein [Streptomyces sp. NPDC001868]|uniref:acyl-CoA thioester hydrolase/BAAT C-terminal domain-containing protein n=1 Tax=Streptomyces sp. NPDC001868 TaxID=3154401 RepID=UPI003322A2D4
MHVEVVEREVAEPWEGVLVAPARGGDVGVLVLAGSSGRVERERARLLARQGMTALAIRWFGGPGQPPGICEVPLETFTAAVGLLRAHGAARVGILGVSKGAEAALLTAVRDPRVDVVVALSPTSLVWCNIGPGLDGEHRPYRSSWTWRGRPLPFVPLDDSWTPATPTNSASSATSATSAKSGDSGPVAVRGWYECSERTFAELLPAAEIPVDRARADLLLMAGGDDAMWPSLPSAERLAERRRAAGAPVRLIAHPDAGHRPRLPGESPAPASPRFRHGGTPEADALLGATAWPHVLDALRGDA